MKKIAFIFFLAFAAAVSANASSTSTRSNFVAMMVPKINQINQETLKLRQHLLYLHSLRQKGRNLNVEQNTWLFKLANNYKVKHVNFNSDKTWDELLRRVDELPVSLVLAQAINESGWGGSYFAQKGNNYFGQWCTVQGCGIVPRRRPEGATYEVKKFASPLASVRSYILNVNTHKSYAKLRDLRRHMRDKHELLSGNLLAEGLQHYSQCGIEYIQILQKIIAVYDFGKLDQA